MYHLTQKLESIHECIRKGEKVRILYEILLSEIGANFENTGQEVFEKLKQSQDEYFEAIKMLKLIMESGQRTNGEQVPDDEAMNDQIEREMKKN